MLRKPPPPAAAATTPACVANSLAPPVSLAVNTTPSFYDYGVSSAERAEQEGGVPSLQSLSALVAGSVSSADAKDAGYPEPALNALAAAEAAAAKAGKKAGKLTCERVHQLMVERLGITRKRAEAANPCFKRGVLMGHIVLTEASTLQDIVCDGECICCSSPCSATIADVLDQPICGGGDYEDGGLEGAVQCEGCCGMYVTGLCEGRAQLDSGKFHNHCDECPDFGECIGDYRTSHCMDCGKHWFSGLSAFACTNCGGGRGNGPKTKPIDQLPPPPLSAFDGVIEGAADQIRENMASMNPLQRILAGALLPEAAEAASSLPPELQRQVRENPESALNAMLAFSAMAGGDGLEGGSDQQQELSPLGVMLALAMAGGEGLEGGSDEEEEVFPSGGGEELAMEDSEDQEGDSDDMSD